MERICPHCKCEVTGRPNKIYCGKCCQQNASYRRNAKSQRRERQVECPNCGTVTTKTRNGKYCSPACRIEQNYKAVPREKHKEYKARMRINKQRKAQGLEPIYSDRREKTRQKLKIEAQAREERQVKLSTALSNCATHAPARTARRAGSMAEAQEHAGREVYG